VASKDGLRLVIDGARAGKRTGLLANGVRVDLPDGLFLLLLRLAVAHLADRSRWSTHAELGTQHTRVGYSRIRRAVVDATSLEVDVVEADGKGRFRLAPEVTVERVAWDVLADHGDKEIRKLGRDRRKV